MALVKTARRNQQLGLISKNICYGDCKHRYKFEKGKLSLMNMRWHIKQKKVRDSSEVFIDLSD